MGRVSVVFQSKPAIRFVAPWFLLLVTIFGCTVAPSESDTLATLADKLDIVERHMEEWGTGSVSQILLQNAGDQFKLEFNQEADKYVEKARGAFQGAAGRLLEIGLVGRGKVGVGRDDTLGAGEAPDAAQPSSRDDPRQRFSGDRFLAARSLAAAPQAISEGDAVKVGLSQKLTELLLKSMTNLDGVKSAGNWTPFFGVCQVSCLPGWRTRTGYRGEVLVSTELATNLGRIVEVLAEKEAQSIAEQSRLTTPGDAEKVAGRRASQHCSWSCSPTCLPTSYGGSWSNTRVLPAIHATSVAASCRSHESP